MRPIIVEMKDMSDSAEVYQSRPNSIMVLFIYLLVALFLIVFCWMYFSKIDIVIKCDGIVRSVDESLDVCCDVSGMITEYNITEGQYVEVGDVLFVVDSKEVTQSIEGYERLLDDINQRIQMLEAYNSYLNNDNIDLEAFCYNKYYEEFVGRIELLELSSELEDKDVDTQIKQLNQELNNLNQLISTYEEQIDNLQQTKLCIKNRSNSFTTEEIYYLSLVESYISEYNALALQYDIQISEYQKQLEDCKQEEGKTATNTDSDALEQQINQIQNNITNLYNEKTAMLNSMELKQITSLEQQIEEINYSLSTTITNKSSIQAKLDILNDNNKETILEVNILTERQNVATELISYETKRTEYENILNQYDLENSKMTVTAEGSGYIYLNQEIKNGSYITQGSMVCQIIPENSRGYYAEIYVENTDIAKLKEGQEVKLETAAYPSSEYGFFNGVIDSISKDIKVNQTVGTTYYLVRVKCDSTTVINKKGNKGTVINGMGCKARIIVDEESVLQFFLKKIGL